MKEHNKVDLEVCSDFLSAAYRAREEKVGDEFSKIACHSSMAVHLCRGG